MSIPKVIHYCWFGGNPKSDIIKKCINSWKEFCPDYEIIEWNETNFDVNRIKYTADAYSEKKWAFVSDYARLQVVYENGGIYLDTDVLLHSSLDELLEYKCWLASDDVRYIATGLGFGAEKHNKLIKVIADAYEGYEYPSGTNVLRDTKIFEENVQGWKKSDRNQIIDGILLIGLRDCSKYAVHLYTYTWAEEDIKKKRIKEILSNKKDSFSQRVIWKIKTVFRSPKLIAYFDKRKGTRLEKAYTFFAYDFLDYGLLHYLKRFIYKLIRK